MTNSNQVIHQLKDLLPTKQYHVFDFDKTIAQLELDWSGWHEGMQKVFEQFEPSIYFDPDTNPHEFHNRLVDIYGDKLAAVVNQFNQDYEIKHISGYTPHQELVDLIKELHTHVLYVYSSNSRPIVLKGLEQLGIIDQFTSVVTRNDVRKVKPYPEGFKLLDSYPEYKSSFLMIGDSSSDRGAAAAADIDFLESTYFVKYLNE